jgi:hypothetical protein
MFARIVGIVVLSVGTVFGCDCIEPSVQAKKDHAKVIFRGTIIELRDSKVAAGITAGLVKDTKKIAVFRVTRVWKGDVGETFEMPAIEETSACIGFWPTYLKVGSDLLVYAWRVGSEYITGICGSHKLAKNAKDYEALGGGADPQKEEQKPK